MNDPQSLPDGGTPKTDDSCHNSDWNLSEEKSSADNSALFDGKIIARMPDLGSESIAKTIVKTIEKPQFPSFWAQLRTSVWSAGGTKEGASANPVTGQQFFHRVTAIGAVVLLCGFGILFYGTGNDKAGDKAVDEAKTAQPSATEKWDFLNDSRSFAKQPEPPSERFGATPHSVIPVAPVESVVAVSPPVSPWDRPAANSFSAWETPPSQPQSPPVSQSGNPFQPIDVAVPPPPPGSVVMSPMTPIGAATVPNSMMPNSMTPHSAMPMSTMPVSQHEMPVSPYEVPRVAQSNYPAMPSGMMPMQGRQENVPGGVLSNNPSVPHQQYPQYPPPQPVGPMVPGHPVQGHPMYGPGVPNNSPQQGQYGQQSQQYAYPPGYMAPNNYTAPPGTPIPSGVSTLPPQGGQNMPHYGAPMQNMQPLGTPPMTRPPSDFYYNPPYNNPAPTSRLM